MSAVVDGEEQMQRPMTLQIDSNSTITTSSFDASSEVPLSRGSQAKGHSQGSSRMLPLDSALRTPQRYRANGPSPVAVVAASDRTDGVQRKKLHALLTTGGSFRMPVQSVFFQGQVIIGVSLKITFNLFNPMIAGF